MDGDGVGPCGVGADGPIPAASQQLDRDRACATLLVVVTVASLTSVLVTDSEFASLIKEIISNRAMRTEGKSLISYCKFLLAYPGSATVLPARSRRAAKPQRW
jgi:hypothetical protein